MKKKIQKIIVCASPFICLLIGIFLFCLWMESTLSVMVDIETIENYVNSVNSDMPGGMDWLVLLGMVTVNLILPCNTMWYLFAGVRLIRERYFSKKKKELKGNSTETEKKEELKGNSNETENS